MSDLADGIKIILAICVLSLILSWCFDAWDSQIKKDAKNALQHIEKREQLISERLELPKDSFIYENGEVLVDGGKRYRVEFSEGYKKIDKFIYLGYED